jgi:hypothetical protein
MLTVKRPAARSRGHVLEVRAGLKVTKAGSSESDEKDWQVNPSGPRFVSAVTTVNPEAKCPKTCRNLCDVGSRRSDIVIVPFQGLSSQPITPANGHQHRLKPGDAVLNMTSLREVRGKKSGWIAGPFED